MTGGFIILDRKLLEWRYQDSPTAFAIWIHILLMANWKDGYFLGEMIPRGSLATSYAHLAAEVGVDPSTLRTWLDRFEKAGMIERKSTNRYTIIKVLNYSTFQDLPVEGYPQRTPERIPQQNPQRTPYNRTKKQEEQSNNISPLTPQGGPKKRGSRSPVRIDTPDWYKRVQSEGITEAEEASPELIAEFEAMKKSFSNKGGSND